MFEKNLFKIAAVFESFPISWLFSLRLIFLCANILFDSKGLIVFQKSLLSDQW